MDIRILDDNEIRDIFNDCMRKDFRKEEIKPLSKIFELKEKGNYRCLGFYEGDSFIGYAFLCFDNIRDFLLLDYYAVSAQMRNRGYGGGCISLMRDFFSESLGIVLETEDTEFSQGEDDYEVRKKRIGFYEKNGFMLHNIKSSIFDADYLIMSLRFDGEKADDEYIYDKVDRIYRVMFNEKQYRDNVYLRAEG